MSRSVVSSSSKLLLAAAFVAAGYGLAAVCGAPASRTTSGWSSGGISVTPAQQTWPDGVSTVGDVSLSPAPQVSAGGEYDFLSTDPGASAEHAAPVVDAYAAVAVAESPAGAPAEDTSLWQATAPRARLADVRPTSGQSPWTAPSDARPSDEATRSSATQIASVVRLPAVEPVPTRQASFDGSDEPSTALATVTVVPVDESEDDWRESAQMHIVVDGDSLARLAGRYLDDPHRGDEIYQLNRDVLTSPDLLPIGAELKIPDRKRSDRQTLESGESRLGAVPQRGLVPVHAVPTRPAAAPRARLMQPIPTS